MNGKVLTILVILIACASMITLGCTGKNTSNPTTLPTQNPSETPGHTASQGNVSTTPQGNVTITPTPSAGTNTSNASASTLDDSLVSISGENDESLPEGDIPTPDAGQ